MDAKAKDEAREIIRSMIQREIQALLKDLEGLIDLANRLAVSMEALKVSLLRPETE